MDDRRAVCAASAECCSAVHCVCCVRYMCGAMHMLCYVSAVCGLYMYVYPV